MTKCKYCFVVRNINNILKNSQCEARENNCLRIAFGHPLLAAKSSLINKGKKSSNHSQNNLSQMVEKIQKTVFPLC